MSRLEQVFSHQDAHIFITAFGEAGERVGWDVLVSVQPAGRHPLRRVPVARQGHATARAAVDEGLSAACEYLEHGTD
jgi:hypothetical protein